LPSSYGSEMMGLAKERTGGVFERVSGITDFIALDVETANADFASIC